MANRLSFTDASELESIMKNDDLKSFIDFVTKKSIDINSKFPVVLNPKFSHAPLICVAAQYGSFTLFSELLKNGANTAYSHDKPLLHYALAGRHSGIINLLLSTDCALDNCFVPLIKYNHLDLIKQFIQIYNENQPDTDFVFENLLKDYFPSSISNKAQYAVKLAVKSQSLEMLKYILENLDPQQNNEILILNDKIYRTALHVACRYNSWEIVEFLFNRDPSQINPDENFPATPLHIAINSKNGIQKDFLPKFIGMILSTSDLDLPKIFNAVDNDSMTILHYATMLLNNDVVRILLEQVQNGIVDARIKNSQGFTPLMQAVVSRNIQILSLFIEMACQHDDDILGIKETDKIGRNILHLAARQDFVDGFQLIHSHFSNLIRQKDLCMMSPLAAAAAHGFFATIEYVIDKLEDARELIESDVVEVSGRNLLHWLAMRTDTESCRIMRKLLERGLIDPNNIVHRATTPLFVAMLNSNEEAVRTLLEFGAQPSVGNPAPIKIFQKPTELVNLMKMKNE